MEANHGVLHLYHRPDTGALEELSRLKPIAWIRVSIQTMANAIQKNKAKALKEGITTVRWLVGILRQVCPVGLRVGTQAYSTRRHGLHDCQGSV